MRRRDLTRLPVRHCLSATERVCASRNGFAMSKTPWLKFYPSDWQADHLLGTCSLAARGLWVEMLCVMHAAEPPASLARNSVALTVPQIAVLARCSVKEAQRCLDELEAAGVFSRDVDGTIFSRRMRRDIDKAERDRANGKNGGNPDLKRRGRQNGAEGVNPDHKGQDKAQIPEARYQIDPSREERFLGGGHTGTVQDRALGEAPPSSAARDTFGDYPRLVHGGGAR